MPTQWQVYLCYVAFVGACTLITIFLPKKIPFMETVFFIASVAGFLVFFITVLATSETKQSASVVFVDWVNLTGWDDGTAFLLGVGQAMYTFLAVDSATHIAEEVPQPGKKVPQTMWMTVLIGITTVLPWTLAFMFSIQDMDAVSTSALPIMEVYLQALRGSKAGAAFFTTWLLFIYFGACIANNRQTDMGFCTRPRPALLQYLQQSTYRSGGARQCHYLHGRLLHALRSDLHRINNGIQQLHRHLHPLPQCHLRTPPGRGSLPRPQKCAPHPPLRSWWCLRSLLQRLLRAVGRAVHHHFRLPSLPTRDCRDDELRQRYHRWCLCVCGAAVVVR